MLFGDSPAPGLVGIARLASESTTLEAKSRVEYFEIQSRSLLNRTKPGMPFTWTVNPYRGCEFGCKYCYARYTHEFMELDPNAFEDRIYAKANVAAILKRELRKTRESEGIAIGTATDPYQPAERRFGLTRSILEVLSRERGRAISVTTKSDLVVRDLDLLSVIRERNTLNINMTITTLNTKLARMLEPRAPRPDLRLKAVHELSNAGISVGVFPNPILPLITDREASLDALAKAAKDAGARYFGGGILFLMPSAQKVFFPFLAEKFPHLLRRYEERYRDNAYLKGAYRETIRERVHAIREKYGLDSGPQPAPILETDRLQPGLFDPV
ncbi:MAG: Radical domain protein [Bryobacterales bacterium]|nr:Radical domain protein [Bryobacterales bacterium]